MFLTIEQLYRVAIKRMSKAHFTECGAACKSRPVSGVIGVQN